MPTSFQTWLGVRYGTAIAIGALQRQLVDDQSASDRKRSSVLEKGPVIFYSVVEKEVVGTDFCIIATLN